MAPAYFVQGNSLHWRVGRRVGVVVAFDGRVRVEVAAAFGGGDGFRQFVLSGVALGFDERSFTQKPDLYTEQSSSHNCLVL